MVGTVTFLVVSINFKGPVSSVLCLSSSVHAFLLVNLHPLVTFKLERLVELSALTAVNLKSSYRAVPCNLCSMPLTVVNRDVR